MSNTTLRELTAEFESVLALALEEDDGEELAGRLAEIDMAIEDKADNYAVIIADLNAQEAKLKTEIDRLTKRRQTLRNNADRMKQSLQQAMETVGKEKIKTDYYSYTIQKNPPKLILDDEEIVPEDYFVTKRELDKASLKDALKAGQEVRGAHLEQTESLRIR